MVEKEGEKQHNMQIIFTVTAAAPAFCLVFSPILLFC
jgi:hypothetical protein